jgi:hypothetical protein
MTAELPARRTDDDTFAVIDDAPVALAQRRDLWLGDDLVLIHLLDALITQAERCLPEAMHGARDHRAGWDDIAALLGTSQHEAWLRFAPDSPIADGRWPITPTD